MPNQSSRLLFDHYQRQVVPGVTLNAHAYLTCRLVAYWIPVDLAAGVVAAVAVVAGRQSCQAFLEVSAAPLLLNRYFVSEVAP